MTCLRAQQLLILMGIGSSGHNSCALLFPWIHSCEGIHLAFIYCSGLAEVHADLSGLPALRPVAISRVLSSAVFD